MQVVKGAVGQKWLNFTGTQRGALGGSGELSFAKPIALRYLPQPYQTLTRLPREMLTRLPRELSEAPNFSLTIHGRIPPRRNTYLERPCFVKVFPCAASSKFSGI